MLQIANFSDARTNLKAYCDDVVEKNTTLIITRKDDKHVVVQSLDNYNLMSNELNNLKKELYIQRKMIQAEKEMALGKSRPLEDVFTDVRAIIEGHQNV